MALILSGGDGGNATITGNSGNLTIANATAILASSATISASGNVTGGNVITAGVVSATGNITGGNILSSGGFYYANGTPFSSGAAATSINLQQNYGGF
jgi:hypothetical protein